MRIIIKILITLYLILIHNFPNHMHLDSHSYFSFLFSFIIFFVICICIFMNIFLSHASVYFCMFCSINKKLLILQMFRILCWGNKLECSSVMRMEMWYPFTELFYSTKRSVFGPNSIKKFSLYFNNFFAVIRLI